MIKNKDIIYRVFFDSKQDKLYYNQLKDITSLSHSSLQTVLKKLKENKEIKEEKTRANIFYSLTNRYKAIEFTKIIIDRIDNLNLDVRTTIKELIEFIPKSIYTCIFFGSASKKQEKDSSDIDLIVVLETFRNENLQDLYNKESKKIINKIKDELETRSIYPISIAYVNKQKFIEKKDYMIKEAVDTGYPIINQINYYNDEK